MPHHEKDICCKLVDLETWIPDFLIDEVKRKELCFRETLIVCSKHEFAKDTKPIGGYCILVETIGPQYCELLVHVQSSMSIDGRFGGSKVISSATSKLHCLEEKRTEFVYEDDGLHERTIFIAIEKNIYHVKLIHACPYDKSTEIKDVPCRFNKRLISEGVNILLMRYLALANYEGTLSFDSITIDGDIITSNYVCTPAEKMDIDNHFLSVYTIERKMVWEDGSTHSIKTYLTSKGRILQHNWLDVPYMLKINPLVDPHITDKAIKIIAPLRDRWFEDIEMLSKYLDMKFAKKAQQIEYMADHPEIKELIADYTQTLLVVKPQNVIDFTIQYFKVFDKCPKTWETSCTVEEKPDVDILSQLAKEKSDVECGICKFSIDYNVQQETWRRSVDVCSKGIDCFNSASSASMETSNTSDEQEQDTVVSKVSINEKTYSSMTNDKHECDDMSEAGPRLKRICDQCQTVVKMCHKDKIHSKCPGCLKVFNICTKCSLIDQILQRLKEDMNTKMTGI